MTSNPFKGLGTALVTPFQKDGSVALDTMKTLVERQIDGGVDMLIPCGTTGEAVTLSDEEYESVVSTVVSVSNGRVPVVAGAGSNSTSRTVQTAHIAGSCGADAVLIVGPYYNKPTQEGLYQHFKTVAESVQMPVVIYNVPGRTSSNITAETQLRIAGIDNIVATKEASGDFSQIMNILSEAPEGFHVLSGDDLLVLPQIAAGIHGVISVIANEVPDQFAALVHHGLRGEFEKAREIHYRLLPLMEINFIESNPIPVKAALALMGLIEECYRLPLVPMNESSRSRLESVLRSLELLP